MKETRIALPRLALIAAARGMLGVGIGLLISERFSRRDRARVGFVLAAVGALSTLPLLAGVLRHTRNAPINGHSRRGVGEGLPAD
jgi:hypothetical protein